MVKNDDKIQILHQFANNEFVETTSGYECSTLMSIIHCVSWYFLLSLSVNPMAIKFCLYTRQQSQLDNPINDKIMPKSIKRSNSTIRWIMLMQYSCISLMINNCVMYLGLKVLPSTSKKKTTGVHKQHEIEICETQFIN